MKDNRTMLIIKLILCLGLVLLPASGLGGQPPKAPVAEVDPPPAGPPPPSPPGRLPPGRPAANSQPVLRYVAPGVFAIGACRIVKAEGKVEFPATVNMQEGALEYLLVGTGGKLHESLLRTEVEPLSLQIALLLAGMEGSLAPLKQQGEDRLPEGDAVAITVRWQRDGQEKMARLDELIRQGKELAPSLPWVFTGSVVRDGVFAAQVERSLIAVYHDPVALIDHRQRGGGDDRLWSVNSSIVPAVGTEMTVSIRKKP